MQPITTLYSPQWCVNAQLTTYHNPRPGVPGVPLAYRLLRWVMEDLLLRQQGVEGEVGRGGGVYLRRCTPVSARNNNNSQVISGYGL